MAEWQLTADENAVATEAVRLILSTAREAIADHGTFRLVLAGGTTPLQAYRQLAETDEDLYPWQLYYGDERCLPVDDAQRNSRMVQETGLVARVGAHYPIPAELGPEQGASHYTATLRNATPFDLVLLGMGEDGHTASLFPGHDWEGDDAIPVHASPKPPSQRVSLSLHALQNCRRMLVLVTGEGKREALRGWRLGERLPVAQVAAIRQARVLVPGALVEMAA